MNSTSGESSHGDGKMLSAPANPLPSGTIQKSSLPSPSRKTAPSSPRKMAPSTSTSGPSWETNTRCKIPPPCPSPRSPINSGASAPATGISSNTNSDPPPPTAAKNSTASSSSNPPRSPLPERDRLRMLIFPVPPRQDLNFHLGDAS